MQEYYTSGFLSLQSAIDAYTLGMPASLEASLDTGSGDSPSPAPAAPQAWTAWGGVFPTAEYVHNDFYDAVGPMLGLLMSLSLVYPLSMLVRGVVEERERRLKETMCIMGLQGALRLLSFCTWRSYSREYNRRFAEVTAQLAACENVDHHGFSYPR